MKKPLKRSSFRRRSRNACSVIERRWSSVAAARPLLDRMCRLAQLQPADELLALAEGALPAGEPLATIVRHTDLVTSQPVQATEQHIRLLEQAGLNNPQIVALSELIAFVNFQTRVAAGLRLLRSA